MTAEYEITDVDYVECDALLKIGGRTVYFQFDGWGFAKANKFPTIVDAIEYLELEAKSKFGGMALTG